MDNKKDNLRQEILEHLNGVMSKAKNDNMAKQTLQQIQRTLRGRYSDEEVSGELMYLTGKRLVKKEIETSTSPIRVYGSIGGKGEKTKLKTTIYHISDLGRDHLEGDSIFRKEYDFSNTVVNNYSGAVAIGVNPKAIVYEPHIEIYSALDDLQNAISKSEEIGEEQGAELGLDIETIKKQISKKKPNKKVIKEIWSGFKNISSLSGLHDLYEKINSLLTQFI